MDLIIRKAGKDDIDALSALLGKLFSMETDFVVDREKQKAGLELFLADSDDRIIFVALFDEVIVGMVTCQLVVSTAVGGYSILLEDMYIVDTFRQEGIG
ncbi:MAG: GNAT family N-acetyltransferase, partial [Syntrophaceae bacterium]|nr:GNAT family N-acetyltransferase [Syntrophaceae bacterium]